MGSNDEGRNDEKDMMERYKEEEQGQVMGKDRRGRSLPQDLWESDSEQATAKKDVRGRLRGNYYGQENTTRKGDTEVSEADRARRREMENQEAKVGKGKRGGIDGRSTIRK